MCFEGLARLSRRVWRRFVRGSREISLVPSLHRASTDALMSGLMYLVRDGHSTCSFIGVLCCVTVRMPALAPALMMRCQTVGNNEVVSLA